MTRQRLVMWCVDCATMRVTKYVRRPSWRGLWSRRMAVVEK